jgi:hypothetical protein
MYYTRSSRNRYGDYDYTPVATSTNILVTQARSKYRHVKRVHRLINLGFLGGLTLVLGQFPFSLLGSTALHVSTSVLGGLMTLVFGGVWVVNTVTNDLLPDVVDAKADLDSASELYIKEILEGGNDVG